MSKSGDHTSQQDQPTSGHHMAGIGVSWALAQTADGALKLSRDAVLAASSDNVQPLALVACEKFGGTLAVSSLARTKMEAMIRKQSKSPISKFLLAKIGYGKGGSLDALSKTGEGIRFLCIASALISSCSNFDAANTLGDMINGTAEDKDLTPTAFQLKDLLEVLEPSINRFRFLDDAHGYQTLIAQTAANMPATIAFPSSSAIRTLVESFREVARIGDADATSIRLATGVFAPWLSAFTRLCMDTPPAIFDSNNQAIVDHEESRVSIYVRDMSKKDIDIEITYAYATTEKVISAVVHPKDKPAQATGMVTLQTHADLLLRELQFDSGLGNRALQQALPYAMHLVKSAYAREIPLTAYKSLPRGAQLPNTVRAVQLLPEDVMVETITRAYLPSESEMIAAKPLEDGLGLTDLPLVSLWVQEHKTYLEVKPQEEFLHRLSHVVADILALSLFVEEGESDPAKLDFMVLHVPHRKLSPMFASGCEWREIVEFILGNRFHEKPKLLQAEPLLNWALKILGHEASDHVKKLAWVASSFRGQVILPRVFLANELSLKGVARLTVFPGTIMLGSQKDRRFPLILSSGDKYESANVTTPGQGLNSCRNSFTQAEIRYDLTSKADHLNLDIGWTFNKNSQRPMHILSTLAGALMMAPCEHPPDTPLMGSLSFVLLPPGSNKMVLGITGAARDQIGLFPLYGNEQLKLLALASISWMEKSLPHDHPEVIINRGACINCLRAVAQLTECSYVVL